MDEWGCAVVQNFRALLQLPPVIEESISSLNGGDVWFRVTVTLISCLLNLFSFRACNSFSSSFIFFNPSRYFIFDNVFIFV